MSRQTGPTRVLDPLERFSEIVFGLIMVLSFTCAMSVAEVGREDVQSMFFAAIGCNLAWGVIDAVFYLISCLAEHGRNVSLLRRVQQSPDPAEKHNLFADVVPSKILEALSPSDLDRIQAHLRTLPVPPRNIRLVWENWIGALGVFLLVVLSTFPVVIPFMIFQNARTALHVSNGVAIVLLFGAGFMLARYSGMRPFLTGSAMVLVGAVLVALTLALGG